MLPEHLVPVLPEHLVVSLSAAKMEEDKGDKRPNRMERVKSTRTVQKERVNRLYPQSRRNWIDKTHFVDGHYRKFWVNMATGELRRMHSIRRGRAFTVFTKFIKLHIFTSEGLSKCLAQHNRSEPC